jgi:hypothetical protein
LRLDHPPVSPDTFQQRHPQSFALNALLPAFLATANLTTFERLPDSLCAVSGGDAFLASGAGGCAQERQRANNRGA